MQSRRSILSTYEIKSTAMSSRHTLGWLALHAFPPPPTQFAARVPALWSCSSFSGPSNAH